MNFTGSLKQAVNIAQSLAKEFSNSEFSPAHLLKALLHKDIGLTELLMALDQDLFYLEEWAEVRIESCAKSGMSRKILPVTKTYRQFSEKLKTSGSNCRVTKLTPNVF